MFVYPHEALAAGGRDAGGELADGGGGLTTRLQ